MATNNMLHCRQCLLPCLPVTPTNAGVPGGIIAPLGLVTPAFLIILVVAKLLSVLWKSSRLQGLFYALRPASVGLIGAAAFSVCAVSLFTWDGSLVLRGTPFS